MTNPNIAWTKKMRTAIEGTIYAYELWIAKLENGGDKEVEAFRKAWVDYGGSCRICTAASASVYTDPFQIGCDVCPLDECHNRTMYDLEEVIDPFYMDSRKQCIAALKARLKWLLKKLDSNGIVLVKKGGK